jgi:hypothetical protein
LYANFKPENKFIGGEGTERFSLKSDSGMTPGILSSSIMRFQGLIIGKSWKDIFWRRWDCVVDEMGIGL